MTLIRHPVWFTLHIQLEPLHLDPPIWRRIVVNGDCTLRRLHHFIQAAMGWTSSHLYEFSLGEQRFMPPDAKMPEEGTWDDRDYKLAQLLEAGDRLRYLYDFGDSWQHVIAVEAVDPAAHDDIWCEVLDGARACPPEDIGGVPGYLAFLDELQSRTQDEAGLAALVRSSGAFDPELFDRHAADAAVRRICNNFWG